MCVSWLPTTGVSVSQWAVDQCMPVGWSASLSAFSCRVLQLGNVLLSYKHTEKCAKLSPSPPLSSFASLQGWCDLRLCLKTEDWAVICLLLMRAVTLTVHTPQADGKRARGLLLWKDGWMQEKKQWGDNAGRLMASPVMFRPQTVWRFSWTHVKTTVCM